MVNFFNFDIKKALLIIFIIIIPIFLMTLNRSKTEKNFLFRSFAAMNSKAQVFYHSLSSSIYETANTYLNLIQTRKKKPGIKTGKQTTEIPLNFNERNRAGKQKTKHYFKL